MTKFPKHQFINQLLNLFRFRAYHTIYLGELPDKFDKNTIYILGEGDHLWSLAMICPCGCGELLQMSLHEDGHPKWCITQHYSGTISLHPSVHRKIGCKSHFFIKCGRIIWCT